MLREKQISAKVETKGKTISIKFDPAEKFENVTTTFFKTFREYGFKRIAEKRFNIDITYSSEKSFKDQALHFIKSPEMKKAFFSSVLEDSNITLSYDTDTDATAVIDSFFDLAFDTRKFPSFCFFEHVDVKAEFDLSGDPNNVSL